MLQLIMENGGIFANNDEFGWLKRVRLVIYKGATLNNLTFKPMILSGTEEKPYEPYTGGNPSPNPDYPQEIESIKDSIAFKRIGKNYNKYPYYDGDVNSKNGITYTAQNDYSIKIEGTSTGESYYNLHRNYKIRKGTYKVSVIGLTDDILLSVVPYLKDGSHLDALVFDKKNTVKDLILEEDVMLDGYIAIVNTGVTVKTVLYLQIEKGTEVTEYEPYHEDVYTLPVQEEMLKINDYEDLFIKKDDRNWYERHVIKKYIVDGENNIFSNMSVGEAFTTFDFNVARNIFAEQEYWVVCDNALCNMFKPTSLGRLVAKNNIEHINKFCTWVNYARFSFENNKFASVDEANQYLSELNANNKPLILYVALKTPEEILCTPEQTAVLNKLEQFYLQKGINHIFSDDELSPKFKLMYYQDINILLDKINKNIADVSAQLIEGGSNV